MEVTDSRIDAEGFGPATAHVCDAVGAHPSVGPGSCAASLRGHPILPITIGPDQAVPHPGWTKAREKALSAILSGPCIVYVLGEAGTGKTLLLEELDRALRKAGAATAFHRRADVEDLAMPSETGACAAVRVVLIDEADRIDQARLANIAKDPGTRLAIARNGLPTDGSFDLTDGPEPASRPVTAVRLAPLPRGEVGGFLSARCARSLARAGSGREVFSDAAVEAIERLSGGVPRLVNTIANAAMFLAASEDAARVEAGHVAEAAELRGFITPDDAASVFDGAPGARVEAWDWPRSASYDWGLADRSVGWSVADWNVADWSVAETNGSETDGSETNAGVPDGRVPMAQSSSAARRNAGASPLAPSSSGRRAAILVACCAILAVGAIFVRDRRTFLDHRDPGARATAVIGIPQSAPSSVINAQAGSIEILPFSLAEPLAPDAILAPVEREPTLAAAPPPPLPSGATTSDTPPPSPLTRVTFPAVLHPSPDPPAIPAVSEPAGEEVQARPAEAAIPVQHPARSEIVARPDSKRSLEIFAKSRTESHPNRPIAFASARHKPARTRTRPSPAPIRYIGTYVTDADGRRNFVPGP